jgi:signal transduction histidine kinase
VVNRLRQDPPPEVGALLFRIAQEALTNAHRHAHASRVWVILDEDDTGVQLTVRDDGRGFDPSRLLDPVPGHLGLVTMRERAAIAGGRFQLDAAPGAGTTITAWVPVQPEHRRDRAQWAG